MNLKAFTSNIKNKSETYEYKGSNYSRSFLFPMLLIITYHNISRYIELLFGGVCRVNYSTYQYNFFFTGLNISQTVSQSFAFFSCSGIYDCNLDNYTVDFL